MSMVIHCHEVAQRTKWTSAGLAENCGREINCVRNRGTVVPSNSSNSSNVMNMKVCLGGTILKHLP